MWCDACKYEIDVEAGVVVSHGPAAPMEGALAMELPTVSRVMTRLAMICTLASGTSIAL